MSLLIVSIVSLECVLCRAGKIEDALTFAQTQMSEAGESNPEVLSELERTLALLAFEQPQKSPFSDLLEQSHRQKVSVYRHVELLFVLFWVWSNGSICVCVQVASELNAAILKNEHYEQTTPRIINLLKLILWAQAELDKKSINYPKMNELSSAQIEPK